MAFELSDDWTMDTVLVCSFCGAEARYAFQAEDHAEECPADDHPCACYDAFVEWAIEDAEGDHDHECPEQQAGRVEVVFSC